MTDIEVLKSLEATTLELAEEYGYRPLGPFAERHGGWEITFHKRSEDLDRFCIVGVGGVQS